MPDWQSWKSAAEQGLQQAKEQASRTAAITRERLRRSQATQRRHGALCALGELVYRLSEAERSGLGPEVAAAHQAVAAIDQEIAAIDQRTEALQAGRDPAAASTAGGPQCPSCGHSLGLGAKFCPECGAPVS